MGVSYKFWWLGLREPLRVVTALKGPSALSSSLNSRTSLKNLKMELKLLQEVSSCLSVPRWKRQRRESWVEDIPAATMTAETVQHSKRKHTKEHTECLRSSTC